MERVVPGVQSVTVTFPRAATVVAAPQKMVRLVMAAVPRTGASVSTRVMI